MVTITDEKCHELWSNNSIKYVHNTMERGAGGVLSIQKKNKFSLKNSTRKMENMILEGEWKEEKNH